MDWTHTFPTRTIVRCALTSVLTLATPPSVAFAQSSVCHSIRGGESVTQLARRLTGDGRNAYQPWFQIIDGSARFVPKSQYDRVRREWRGCIVKSTSGRRVQAAVHDDALAEPDALIATPLPISTDVPPVSHQPVPPGAPVASLQRMAAAGTGSFEGVDLTLVWLGAALILPMLGWFVFDDYARRRQTASVVMQQFARRFVQEFERPLIQQEAERPVRSHLRLSPVRSRMEILLAPGQGRCYPNLSDHRKNVEYDVVRITGLIADDSFVRDPLYAHAGWVVVPFRFKAVRKHTGVT